MADITNIKNLTINTSEGSYQINVSDIYAEMGCSEERFAELLGRDFYCPVLGAAPDATTLTYIDTDGSTNHFAIGQECRVPEVESSEYVVYKFLGTYQGNAVWTRPAIYDPMHMTYVEEWAHTKTPYRSGSLIKFNQEFFIALKETSLPPVDLVLMEDGVIAMIDGHTYATKGSFDAEGNTDDWRKVPADELRLASRRGTLDGVETDVRELETAEEVYAFKPYLEIDFVRGTVNGMKFGELVARLEAVERKLGL